MQAKIVILEDRPFSVESTYLRALEERACCERWVWESFNPETLFHCAVQLLLTHPVSGHEKAISLFGWLRRNAVQVPVLTILPESPDKELMHAASAVADDFLFWPLREDELDLRIGRILGPQPKPQERIREMLGDEMGLAQLVGGHSAFLQAVEKVKLFGGSDASVVITGETGTGKELFAHAIHSLSRRRSGPFVPLDCGALPEHLAENELFGHRRGAFTDAHADQKGLAAMAEGGTLFLDEIDALSLANQAKLLRFLQEGTYRALGAEHFTRADTRIIAATNRNLEDCVRQKVFRNDLYFRLNVLGLHLVPLRERHGDVSILARHLLENECASQKCERKQFSTCALRKLENHDWPGNVRELLNTVRRAVVHALGRQILADHILFSSEPARRETGRSSGGSFRNAKQQAIERFERAYVEELLSRNGGNVTQAARESGTERRAFGRLAKKYGLGFLSAR